MPDQWFYASSGGQAGPLDTDELRRLAGEGGLQPTDLVWREGLPAWMPAAKVPELFPAAADAPGGAADLPAAGYAPLPAPDYSSPAAVLPYQGGGVPVGISARTMELLRQTRPWVIFFSVLGFLATGLMLLVGLFITVGGMATRAAGMRVWIGLLYVAFAAIYLFPSIFLWRYGMRIGSLVARGHAEDLELALEAQKSFWRFTGILTIVVIVLYVVAIVVMMVAMSRF